jgi:hypothetical protein
MYAIVAAPIRVDTSIERFMELSIKSHGLDLCDSLRTYAERAGVALRLPSMC